MEAQSPEASTPSSIAEGDFEAPPLRRAPTSSIKTPPIVTKFVSSIYTREHHTAMAEQAKLLIERGLKHKKDYRQKEILAKVTCRAKSEKSLEEKLKLRSLDREYNNADEIWEDIKDLAGVRVILYTPNQAQRESVKEVVTSIWPKFEEKPHGGLEKISTTSNITKGSPSDITSAEIDYNRAEKQRYTRKHFGYQAVHYRVRMRQDQESDSYQWKKHDQVEIQVVTALGHAWAEAGHDVSYKQWAYGPPSDAEERILDALSGLVSSGDILLEQFSELFTNRIFARWEYSDQFTTFLRDCDLLEKAEAIAKDKRIVKCHFGPDTTDLLFRFLVKVDSNFPLAIRNALIELGYPDDTEERSQVELQMFEPLLKIQDCFLASFCLISFFLRKTGQAEDLPAITDNVTRCRTMMDAMILLQTFACSPSDAKGFLESLRGKMTEQEMKGINFVLLDPERLNIDPCDQGWINETLQPAWDWFQEQALDEKSLCGLFFRLAVMGVPLKEMKEMNDHQRRKELRIGKIGSLSGSGV
ncbi:hypothetical protein BS50DRAFT_674659 [Corynespora cassiicola Philippines]|uniref:RelA/SpoT domain-containing protein n=1 Tax=Corynespora cassiicola Philippines TaxID=1448308 RepID=A0A2T2NXS2_CORCC|nr:hypothetical protein BS50DRAFT_674659 [Corynespora cassiicola Philippines]